jgi:hypothetical protein
MARFTTPKDHLMVLCDRVVYIDSLIEQKKYSENSLHRRRAERAALKFAINVLIAHLGYDAPENFSKRT